MTQKRTPICVPIRERCMADALLKIQAVQSQADMLEIWLDQIEDLQVERLFSVKRKPYLCVCKSKREKGGFVGTTQKRINILEKCVDLGAEYVDLNIESPVKWIKQLVSQKKDSSLILSHHNFLRTPSVRILSRLTTRMFRLGADVVKIATIVRSIEDIAVLYKLAHSLNNSKKRHIIIGMGKMGQMTRIYSPLLQNEFMFAPLDGKQKTADGQLTKEELLTLWKVLI